jgi:hypothetical protein
MAIYAFKCPVCGAVLEELMPMDKATFEDRPCPHPKCLGYCVYQLKGAPAVATANMSNPTFDVVVGVDAEKRWKQIKERQAVRDKIRKETGQKALIATSHEAYRVLPGTKLREVVIPEKVQEPVLSGLAK